MAIDEFVDRTVVAIAADRAGERSAILAGYRKDGVDLIVGEQVASFGYTRSLLATMTPEEWAATSEFVSALLGREPLASQARYSAMRMLLWGFSEELYSYARSAGYVDASG